jgi:hypothetical protein
MRNVSDKSCRENQNTHFMISNVVSENRDVYKVTWKIIVERGSLTDDDMAHEHFTLGTLS